jgi:hypothetical protein
VTVRALDRLLFVLRAPGTRGRAAYRVLAAIAALERTPPERARVAAPAVARRPPPR